jgi:hypothetical protein
MATFSRSVMRDSTLSTSNSKDAMLNDWKRGVREDAVGDVEVAQSRRRSQRERNKKIVEGRHTSRYLQGQPLSDVGKKGGTLQLSQTMWVRHTSVWGQRGTTSLHRTCVERRFLTSTSETSGQAEIPTKIKQSRRSNEHEERTIDIRYQRICQFPALLPEGSRSRTA